MARTKGLNGLAIGMIGAGGLLLYSAIKGTSPLTELRGLLTGRTPDPLSKTPSYTPTPAGGAGPTPATGKAGRAATAGSAPHVAAEMAHISETYGVDTGGFARSGHIANSDHYRGLAIDAMTGSRKDIGNAIVAEYQGKDLVKYIIWQSRIWHETTGQWSSCGPGCARCGGNCHETHVHISFYPLVRGRIGR